MIADRRSGIRVLVRESVRPLLALFAWDVAVVLAFQLAHRPWMDQPALPFSLIGSALVLFLNGATPPRTTAGGKPGHPGAPSPTTRAVLHGRWRRCWTARPG